MIEGIPRISVYIISYNQENVIRRTLDSVIAQIDYVYEICVSDDHSTDSTWDILNEYSEKYPGLFKLNRNDPNLGIFENTEKVWTMPTGDIVYDLAGDDSIGEGWFKTVVEYIQKNKIDYKNELFCIYGDYKKVYPNGDSIIEKNDLVKLHDALKLSIRGLISNRSTCYSIKVLNKFEKVSQGRSHIAEDAQDRQLQLFTEQNYYISQVGNIYFSAVGVSSQIDTKIFEERKLIHKYSMEFLKSHGIIFNADDGKFMSKLSIYDVQSMPGHTLLDVVKSFFGSYEREYGIRSMRIRSLLFAIVRRLPHKHSIHW